MFDEALRVFNGIGFAILTVYLVGQLLGAW